MPTACSSRSASCAEPAASATCLPTFIVGFSEVIGSWKTAPRETLRTWRRTSGLALSRSVPATRARPLVRGCEASGSRPSRARLSTLLPEPDSPTRPTISPLPISRSMPRTASIRLPLRVKATCRSRTSATRSSRGAAAATSGDVPRVAGLPSAVAPAVERGIRLLLGPVPTAGRQPAATVSRVFVPPWNGTSPACASRTRPPGRSTGSGTLGTPHRSGSGISELAERDPSFPLMFLSCDTGLARRGPAHLPETRTGAVVRPKWPLRPDGLEVAQGPTPLPGGDLGVVVIPLPPLHVDVLGHELRREHLGDERIGREGVDRLQQRARQPRDLLAPVGPVVRGALHRVAGIEAELDALQAGGEHQRERQVGVGRGVHPAVLHGGPVGRQPQHAGAVVVPVGGDGRRP